MKLSEVYSKPLAEVIQQLEMVELKVHTTDAGLVRAIELKYEDSAYQVLPLAGTVLRK